MKKIVLSISGVASFCIAIVLLVVANHLCGDLDSQNMAKRWSVDGGVAQISCFFSVNSSISKDTIEEFEHSIDGKLLEASIVSESENPSARLWADAYSADGKITLSNDNSTLEADAIGIGGDFFLFHPVKLLEGGYFSGNDLMQDYCVIDEDAAWQLFGSNNVVGQIVYIGNEPHIVTGVIEREDGKLVEKAGMDSTLVYVSYDTLSRLGQNNGINHYEVVMPNPVDNFAFNYVKEQLGSNEKEVEILENSSRYSLLSRIKLLGEFGTRSMNGKAIIYPYWENVARGYEDIIAVLTLFMLLFIVYPVVLLIAFIWHKWRHKTWTAKSVAHMLGDRWEDYLEKRRNQKRNGNGNDKRKEGTKKGLRLRLHIREEDEEEWL